MQFRQSTEHRGIVCERTVKHHDAPHQLKHENVFVIRPHTAGGIVRTRIEPLSNDMVVQEVTISADGSTLQVALGMEESPLGGISWDFLALRKEESPLGGHMHAEEGDNTRTWGWEHRHPRRTSARLVPIVSHSCAIMSLCSQKLEDRIKKLSEQRDQALSPQPCSTPPSALSRVGLGHGTALHRMATKPRASVVARWSGAT